MASRLVMLPLVLTLATLAAGCGTSRAPLPGSHLRTAAQVQAHADLADEPCDPAVARRVDANAPIVGLVSRPAVRVAAGPDKPAMLEIPSPNRHDRPNGPQDITAIVLHHTASPANAERNAMFFAKPSSKVSAHYVVGKDGTIVQCVPDTAASWHAGRSTYAGRNDVNAFSIGIEICNLGDNKDDYPAAEYAALGKLMAYLMTTHDLGWDRVTRHRDVATPLGRKNDTSNNFDRKVLEQAVADAGGPSAAAPEMRFGLHFPSFN